MRGDNGAFFAVFARDALHRDIIGDRPVGDDDAGGMGAGVAVGPLQLHGDVDQLADVILAFVFAFQVGALLKRFGKRDVEHFGHHRGEAIDAFKGNIQHAANVFDRRLGCHRPKGADLGDGCFAVFFADVLDDFLTAILAEVDVDIGRLRAVRVEEALEQQIIFERADMAQLQDIADDRPARGATRPGGDAPADGEADEIPSDEEIAGETHFADDREFVLQPFLGRRHAGLCFGPGVLAVAFL